MKYLFTFESYSEKFENFESENSQLIGDIKDILYDCEDIDIKTSFWICKYYTSKKSVDAIRIIFQDSENRFFTIGELRDILNRIKYLADSEKFSIILDIPSEEDTELPFDTFFEEWSGEEIYRVGMFIYQPFS